MHVLPYIYVSSILIAFLSSLISFRLDLPVHLKLFSLLLGLTFVLELRNSAIIRTFHGPNYWVYNLFMPLEFWVYGLFFYRIIQHKISKAIIRIYLYLFPLVCLVSTYFFFKNNWNSYVFITGSLFTIGFVLMYYYQLITSKDVQPLSSTPEFWIATGMLIFYAIAIPYYGPLSYLVKNNNELARLLLIYVYMVFDTIMYLLFSYGYLCRILNSKKS